MSPNQECYDFIKSHEGCKLLAYQDSAGIWTIGYGTIIYENGVHVKRGDTITQARAEQLLQWQVNLKAAKVTALTSSVSLTQHKYNALTSFAYNAGTGALQSSTLLKKVLANPNDPTIRDSFLVWDKAHVDGKLVVVQGLHNRRVDEANLYFS